jgi:hypothetical protein
MAKSTNAENFVKDKLLNGYVCDTRNLWYSEVQEKAQDIERKAPLQSSYIKMKCLLNKGTDLRRKFTGENLDKIPFDFFVENKNDTYFIEVKLSENERNTFSWTENQTIGGWASIRCKIPLYFIVLYARPINLDEIEVDVIDLKCLASARIPVVPSKNKEHNKRMLQNWNFFTFEFCDEETCNKIIKKEYHDLL